MNINIEEIMKPYFDIKEDIRNKVVNEEQKKQQKLDQITIEKNILNIRLEKLRDNKEEEIKSYLRDTSQTNYNFSNSYAYVIRKDLEKSYEEKENEILNQIKRLDEEVESLNNTNYSHLMYEKKLPGLKETIRVKLSKLLLDVQAQIERKELELKLIDIDIKSVRSQFYSWDIEQELQGRLAPYYNQKQLILKQIEQLKDLLNIVKENQKILFNDEELKEILKGNMQLSEETISPVNGISVEEIEDDLNQIDKIDQTEIDDADIENIQEQLEEFFESDPNKEQKEDFDSITEINSEESNLDESIEQEEIFESVDQLLVTVFDDILKSTDSIRKVKINKDENGYKLVEGSNEIPLEDENIELSNGTYLNESDFEQALVQYGKAEKGRVLKVEGIENEFEITKKTINKIKRALKKRSAKRLLVENKLGSFDIKRVFGRDTSGIFSQFVQIGEGKINIPEGMYINMNELIYKMKNVIDNNKQIWIKGFFSSIKEKLESYQGVQKLESEELFEQEVNNSKQVDNDFNFEPLEEDDEYIDVDFNSLEQDVNLKTR